MKLALQIVYATIFPIVNMFFNFALPYEVKDKPNSVLRVLLCSSVFIYSIWIITCIILVGWMFIDSFNYKTSTQIVTILLDCLLFWTLIKYWEWIREIITEIKKELKKRNKIKSSRKRPR